MFITSALGKILRPAVIAIAAVAISACDAGSDPAAGAEPSPEAEFAARGELLSFACLACHTLDEGGNHQIGPNLHQVFGRQGGIAAGFDYSDAMRNAGIVWTPAELDRWLADPGGFLPGTTMAFTGYKLAEDRRALIEYLVAATSR